jgi:hypothetical protein
METAGFLIALLALGISGVTAWLTLFRRGTIRMTQPTLLFFGPDGPGGPPKVFLRTLLYSTAKRGQIVENMFVRLRRGESVQNFNIWVYGDGPLARGSGLFVGENGVTCNHHFLLPKDGTRFEFLAGDYVVEACASLVGGTRPLLLNRTQLAVRPEQAEVMRAKGAGLFFDWGPDARAYHSHVDERPELPSSGPPSNPTLERAR